MNKLQKQIENAAYRTYNIAAPEVLRVNGISFLDLPYDKKIYVEKGGYYMTKVKHAESIGVYRFEVEYKEDNKPNIDLTYDPNGERWVSVDWDFLTN